MTTLQFAAGEAVNRLEAALQQAEAGDARMAAHSIRDALRTLAAGLAGGPV